MNGVVQIQKAGSIIKTSGATLIVGLVISPNTDKAFHTQMCGGVQYTDKANEANKTNQPNKTWKIYFPNPKAALPILKKDGEIEWVKWGKRKEEDGADLKFFAPGGWARLDSINEGKWKRFHPVPVKIPVQSFMEKDENRTSHWIDVPAGQVIQGLLATHDDQARVYVVTTETPPEFAWVHDRWPRLVALAA